MIIKQLKVILSIFLLFGTIFLPAGCITSTVTDVAVINTSGFPRLAMWWPDTWEQPLNDLKRYDWIGFGSWDNISTINKLAEINPHQKHFMDFSITETSWSSWQNDISGMEIIPSEWFLTQMGTRLAESVDRTQTSILLEEVLDNSEAPLFEIGDNLTCEFETMKILSIDIQNKRLGVQRGFIREANPHEAGIRIAPHITFWPETWVMNMSSFCPEIDVNDGNGPQTWIEFACRNKEIENEQLWDGYIVDRIEKEQSWLIPTWCRSIDPNCSNTEVSDEYALLIAPGMTDATDFWNICGVCARGKH